MLFLSFTNKDIQPGMRETVHQIPEDWIYAPFCGLISRISTTTDQHV